MASEFITRVERDKDEPYTVIFRTDDADKYKHIEDECRRMIGHEKPTVDAVPVEWIKNHIREQVECDNRTYAMKIKAMLDWYMLKCADGERREDERRTGMSEPKLKPCPF